MANGLTLSAANSELILKQFLRILEFTLDIDRNKDDASFVESGGEIFYIFDENVFELFIQPQNYLRYARQVELFHSDVWSENTLPKAVLRAVSAQTALVTTEYLFSGKLPGQEKNIIYMTDWHFAEFSQRIIDYTAQLRKDILDGKVPADSGYSSHESTNSELVDPVLQEDLSNFAEKFPDDPAALERFRDARVAARDLVRDNPLLA